MTRLKRDDLSEQNMKAEKRQFLKGNHELNDLVFWNFSPPSFDVLPFLSTQRKTFEDGDALQ